MIKQLIQEKIIEAVKEAVSQNKLGQMTEPVSDNLFVEKTRNPEFGDYAVNVSSLARYAKLPPVKISESLAEFINIEDVQINIIAGFINFKLGAAFMNSTVKTIIEKKDNFGKNNYGNAEKVLIEYISANPTGPLHIGHGRWAVVGSVLADLMEFSGYNVSQEFYINDAGNQINNLAKSLWLRVLQELEEDAPFPVKEEDGAKNYYPGDYLIDAAKKYLQSNKEKAMKFKSESPDFYNPSEEIVKEMAEFAKADMHKQQKDLLDKFGVEFDTWYSEISLYKNNKVEEAIEKLKSLDKLYEKDGAVWLKTTDFGDDQDRVLRKADKSFTYLTPDIAYHDDKFSRADRLINIWGADHHGYITRMKAAMSFIGNDPEKLEVLLGQLVNLIIGGEQVRMGKRKKMLTLEDLINEVGKDATRFWMIMRSIDTTLDFDVDLAKSSSDENPVYYVQYAHARACSILRNSVQNRINQDTGKEVESILTENELSSLVSSEKFDSDVLDILWQQEDENSINATKALILKLESFEDLIINAVKNRTPYQIARYAQELASDFHSFYSVSRVLTDNSELTKAKLSIVFATKQVISNALKILGVSAPEKM